VKGCRQKATPNLSRSEYTVDFLPKIKIEIVLSDSQAQPAVDAIVKAGRRREKSATAKSSSARSRECRAHSNRRNWRTRSLVFHSQWKSVIERSELIYRMSTPKSVIELAKKSGAKMVDIKLRGIPWPA